MESLLPERYMPKEVAAKRYTRELCANFHIKLPLELREHIYSYLVDPRPVILSRHKKLPFVPRNGEERLDTDYLGPEVAREFARYCYRTLDFEVLQGTLKDITTWLKAEDKHGLIRGDHVRNILIGDPFLSSKFIQDTPKETCKPETRRRISFYLLRHEADLDLEAVANTWIRNRSEVIEVLLNAGYRIRLQVFIRHPVVFQAPVDYSENLALKVKPLRKKIEVSKESYHCKGYFLIHSLISPKRWKPFTRTWRED
ncbi:hypothetical protein M011DRAFT_181972 [Sporormia fimetaria CBS 119925]|uniref:Uncharacterized protein n=1 Tax=Sporormia fimetaria CBS 119925 TaxID=1340428 RepID=A0A6A6VMF0_9PLEO|nr:hypothetical protein M011DRAFT_181972 [Sporormia fimetaria CBS 119925]